MLSKIYTCPADKKYGCTWEGSSDDIFEHFSQEHEELLYFTGLVNIALDITSENRLLLVDTEIYLLQTKTQEELLNIYLRYLGPQKIASNLTYDIDILSSNGTKMCKHDIKMRDGYFSIPLDCIKTCFGDVSMISCQLLVSGDFTSNSSNDSVFLEDNIDIANVEHVYKRQDSEDSNDLTPNLQYLFSTPKEGNSPVESRDKREFSRTTWYAPEIDSPKEHTTSLNRSHTFTYEDSKRSNLVKRQASMRSLSSIAESDIDLELKCSNCDAHLASPIFLCQSDHNICANCYRENKECSICNKEITAIRNEELEEKSAGYLFACINKKNGCTKRLPSGEIEDHEINCMFCQYLCPMLECGFKSGYKNMVCHLNLIHSSVKMFQSFIAVFQKYQELFLVNEMMGIFYCNWTLQENKVLWKAKFCGPKARKFFCELKFKGKNFKTPLLLTKIDDYYFKEIGTNELKEQKLKAKNSILTITR